MQALGRLVKSITTVALILCVVWGCAGQGMVAKTPEAQKGEAAQKGAIAKRTDRILDVQIQDTTQETTVRLAGNAPFQDYEFRREGEDGFSLRLGDIKDETGLPSLPASSERLKLTYSDGRLAEGIQLLGVVRQPFDQYVLNNVGNDLVLILYYGQPTPGAIKENPLPAAPSTASGRAPEKVQPALHASPPPQPLKPQPRQPASLAAAAPDAPRKSPAATQPPAAQPVAAQSAAAQQLADQPLPSPLRKQYTGKPISLDLLDADLRNVLRLLSDITGTNIVIEPDVSGRVTLKVEQVPWDQVLDMVLAMNDLGKEQIGPVIRIARQSKLKQEYNQQAEEIRAKQELSEAAKETGELTTVYLTVNYAQPNAIRDKINEIKSERGRISVDDRTSLIIYSDYPYYIENARKLLARLDKATPQVLIEARIVTMTTDVTRSLGIDWNLSTQHVGRVQIPMTQDFQVNGPPGDLFAFTMAQVIGETLLSVDLRLSALETANQLNVMAAPRVLTVNHVKAVITQGTQIPYLVVTGQDVASTEFKDATLELQVTPHITPDRRVRLEIQAKQDEPTAVNFQVGQSVVPGIDTRKITTELLVDDANVVVIGGVIRNRDTEARTATPGLYRIPILGRLFRSDTKSTSKTELLIFISPRIVETSGPPDRGV